MTPIFINAPYHMVQKNIPRILSLQIGVEIYIDNHCIEDISTGDAKQLGNMLLDHGIICTVHAPFMDLSPGGFDKKVRAITIEKLLRTVEVSSLFNAKAVVCHPGYDKWRFDGNEQLWLDGSIETWSPIIRQAKGGPHIFIENIFEENPTTLAALFDHFKKEDIWYCFDSGHFNLFSKVSLDDWFKPLRERVREMHLHDNYGTSDDHMPIGRGVFPFRELKIILKQIQQPVIFTTEVHDESYAAESITKLREFLS